MIMLVIARGVNLTKEIESPVEDLKKCMFSLSCKFDHGCSVPKCGKFVHGAHICRLCKNNSQGQEVTPGSSIERIEGTVRHICLLKLIFVNNCQVPLLAALHIMTCEL